MNDTQSLMNAAFDSRSLNDLKRDVTADPKGKALQVAQQVEGMFVQMMLKSMREALPQDGILSNEQTKLFTSMYDQQIAQDIGKRGNWAWRISSLNRWNPPKPRTSAPVRCR